MSVKQWEKKVLEAPGAEERVRQIEVELRLAAGLTALREKARPTDRRLPASDRRNRTISQRDDRRAGTVRSSLGRPARGDSRAGWTPYSSVRQPSQGLWFSRRHHEGAASSSRSDD